ncbi:STAS domain-containing protein [Nonomuraea sp. NPDC005983]|uniref:STAS domain-containing protein n=1 Tax=Nonomuraea sp. NPDC005983 TaxID=3155595 RepID=UPI0033A8D867
MTDLSVEVERTGGAVVVRLGGDLDKLTAPRLGDCLSGLVREGEVEIVIDAERLSFCDSSGLWVLVEHQRRVGARQGALRLTGVHGVLLRVLDVTGLRAAFDVGLPAQL